MLMRRHGVRTRRLMPLIEALRTIVRRVRPARTWSSGVPHDHIQREPSRSWLVIDSRPRSAILIGTALVGRVVAFAAAHPERVRAWSCGLWPAVEETVGADSTLLDREGRGDEGYGKIVEEFGGSESSIRSTTRLWHTVAHNGTVPAHVFWSMAPGHRVECRDRRAGTSHVDHQVCRRCRPPHSRGWGRNGTRRAWGMEHSSVVVPDQGTR